MMKNLKIRTKNGKEYNVLLASDKKDKMRGLSVMGNMEANSGMLFVWNKPSKPFMVMKGMKFDLDFIFLSSDNTIVDVQSHSKDSKKKIFTDKKISAILEVNSGNKDNFVIGDKIELLSTISVIREKGIIKLQNGGIGLTKESSEAMMIGSVKYNNILEKDIKLDPNAIQILDTNGYVIANLKGGEIIFSIPDTKDIFMSSLKVNTDKEKEELGLKILGMLDKQQSKESLYVKN